MRAIGYFRAEGGGASRDELEKAFAEYCDKNLHQPVRTFVDMGRAQDGAWPEYLRMLEFMGASRGSYLVVVPDARHLGDDLESLAGAIVELDRMGAKVACSDEELPDPLQNALQTLGVKGVSRSRSAKITESMRARAMQAQGLGKPPYGYRKGPDGTLEVVRDEAAVVELIYRLYTKDDLGLRLIAQHLNERGVPTRRGGQWNMVTIRDILRNPAYMGTYIRFGMRLPRSHEAIIPPDAFRAAQDKTATRRPRGRVISIEPFLLSGLVYCGYCGNKMMGVTRRQTWKRRDGRRARGVYRYYQCQSRNNLSTCEYHTWRAPLLESTVLSQLRYALQARPGSSGGDGPSTGSGQAHLMSTRKEEARAIWDARAKSAERSFIQAVKRASRGEIGIAALGQYLEELGAARRVAAQTGRQVDVNSVLDSWESLQMPERQSFLMENVARIVVRDNNVEVIV
jgi:site-specific DNA recombinase